MRAAIYQVAEEIHRQVASDRDKRRKHRKSGTPTIRRPESVEAPARPRAELAPGARGACGARRRPQAPLARSAGSAQGRG